jgi:hypothetical protein
MFDLTGRIFVAGTSEEWSATQDCSGMVAGPSSSRSSSPTFSADAVSGRGVAERVVQEARDAGAVRVAGRA